MRFLLGSFCLVFALPLWALSHSKPATDIRYSSQVFIRTLGIEEGGGEVSALCNGTLIGPQVLVTAAHCVRDAYVKKNFQVQLDTGYYKFVTRADGSSVRLGYRVKDHYNLSAQFYFLPSLQARLDRQGLRTGIGPSEDVALVILSGPVVLDSGYAKIASQAQISQILSRIGSMDSEVVTINPLAEISTDDTRRVASLSALSWNSGGYFESKSDSRVEEGDSGAGLFLMFAEGPLLVGVVKGRAQSFFGDWDVFALVGQNLCLMKIDPHFCAP